MTLREALDKGLVPSDRIRDLIIRERPELDPHGTPYRLVAKMEQQPFIEFDVADRLFCDLGLVEHWRGGLIDIYEGVNLSGKSRYIVKSNGSRRCQRPGCNEWFTPKPRANKAGSKLPPKYCSRYCNTAAYRMRKGIQPLPSESSDHRTTGYVCRNGHERTPQNTVKEAGRTVRCLDCKRENDRKRKERRRIAA